MWMQIGLAAAAIVAVGAVLRRILARGGRDSEAFDAGAVSESWLAEQRSTKGDSSST